MTMSDTNRNNYEKNSGDATFDFAAFVASHRSMLDYLIQFGTITEKAKASIVLELAGVKM